MERSVFFLKTKKNSSIIVIDFLKKLDNCFCARHTKLLKKRRFLPKKHLAKKILTENN